MRLGHFIVMGVVFSMIGCTPAGRGRLGSDDIRVVSATYGPNCNVRRGNVTARVADFCDDRAVCEYRIDVTALGDPAPGCAKEFYAEYRCGSFGGIRSELVPAEANGKILRLQCSGVR
ncbi:MAG TPA: hypothetical protein VNN13_09150 [Methylomirabilota bacterium]|nr:hypothetical protein [Methylomirabilota bacterium]